MLVPHPKGPSARYKLHPKPKHWCSVYYPWNVTIIIIIIIIIIIVIFIIIISIIITIIRFYILRVQSIYIQDGYSSNPLSKMLVRHGTLYSQPSRWIPRSRLCFGALEIIPHIVMFISMHCSPFPGVLFHPSSTSILLPADTCDTSIWDEWHDYVNNFLWTLVTIVTEEQRIPTPRVLVCQSSWIPHPVEVELTSQNLSHAPLT